MAFDIVIVALIFLIAVVIAYFIGHKIGSFRKDRYWHDLLPGYRKDAIQKSRAVLSGNFSEQLAPYLPDFPYNPNEVRFVGKPIDFIVFKGMDEKEIKEIVFVEVKSGKSKLSNVEKSLKESVDKGKVKWEEYRIPEDITRNKDEE